MISALRHHANTEAPYKIPPGVGIQPRLIINTLDGGSIGPSVHAYASTHQVQVIQLEWEVIEKEDGKLYAKCYNPTDIEGKAAHAVKFLDTEIICPALDPNEIDPEIFYGG